MNERSISRTELTSSHLRSLLDNSGFQEDFDFFSDKRDGGGWWDGGKEQAVEKARSMKDKLISEHGGAYMTSCTQVHA